MTSYQVIEASWSEHEEVLKDIRRQVFIEEQEIPQAIEWDGMDEEATHFLALDKAHLLSAISPNSWVPTQSRARPAGRCQ